MELLLQIIGFTLKFLGFLAVPCTETWSADIMLKTKAGGLEFYIQFLKLKGNLVGQTMWLALGLT